VRHPGGSQGQLCLGGAVARFLGAGEAGPASAAGVAALQVDLMDLPGWGASGRPEPGETLYFQAWYRDVQLGGGATSNLTEAVAVTLR